MQGYRTFDEAADDISTTFRRQKTATDIVVHMLDNTAWLDSTVGKPQRSALHDLLDLYGPELLDILETGMAGRQELIGELITELPHLRAEQPESWQATMTRLESTSLELNHASMRLKEYIRSHFPVSGTSA